MMVPSMPVASNGARLTTRALLVALAYGLALCSTSAEVRSERANQARSEGERHERPHEVDNKSAAPPRDQPVHRNGSRSRGLSREESEQLRRDVEEYGREIYRGRRGERRAERQSTKRPVQRSADGR